MIDRIKVPQESLNLILKSVLSDYSGVNTAPAFGASNQFDSKRFKNRLNTLRKDLGRDYLCGKKILEIGSGGGMLLAILRKEGIEAYGVEPDKYSIRASKKLFEKNKISRNIVRFGYGEALPYKENSFDIVVSFQVLEHTKDPCAVLAEARRVLKPGGIIYFVVPNYNSFWEGHYNLIWMPFFGKRLAKIYVRFFGRNPNFIDRLYFITPNKLRVWSKKLGLKIISLGTFTFSQNVQFAPIKRYWANSPFLMNAIIFFRRTGLAKIISEIFKKFDFYYPIYYIAKK